VIEPDVLNMYVLYPLATIISGLPEVLDAAAKLSE
jgi:hypothetical protein